MSSPGHSRETAPPLLVRSVGMDRPSPTALASSGGALLVFVSEECPTSALALRRLAPLVPALEAAGLSAAAVFEDPLEVAVRTARRLGWIGIVLSEDPPYETSRLYRLESVPTFVLVLSDGTIAGRLTGWDRPALHALLDDAARLIGRGGLPSLPAEPPEVKPGCSSKANVDPALLSTGRDGIDEMEEMFERGWTDGLPVVPPTTQRVEAMLAGRDADASLGQVPPGFGEATLERVAACAVLAGCHPSYFPIVLAAVEAALDPAFNLHGQAVTTQPAGQLVVVNGPVRERIGLNSGMGALGPGWRPNLTIGRALRLLVTLTGAGMPGSLDRATLGHPGKVGFLISENEEVSPWEPLHVERGFDTASSAVTLIACDAPLSISEHRSRTPEDLAHILGWAASTTWSTNWWPLEEPSVFVICPEHAEMFRSAGWSKATLRDFIFSDVRRPAGELRRGETTPQVQAADARAEVAKWVAPESIVFVVAGGEAGRYSAVLGPCTGMKAEMVSREVALE